MSSELQQAVEQFVTAFDQGDAAALASIYSPDFLNIHVDGSDTMAQLTGEQILYILKASNGAAHALPAKEPVVHHAEDSGDSGYVLMSRLKNLGNGWEPVFYNLIWRKTSEKWLLFREFVWQNAFPAFC